MALFLSKGCQDFKHLQKATYFVYIYKMSKDNFELRQERWLKGKRKGTGVRFQKPPVSYSFCIHIQNLYIKYKVSKENFDLRQEGWLKGEMNATF